MKSRETFVCVDEELRSMCSVCVVYVCVCVCVFRGQSNNTINNIHFEVILEKYRKKCLLERNILISFSPYFRVISESCVCILFLMILLVSLSVNA